MNSTMIPNQPIHQSTSDSAFFQLVGDLDFGRPFPNQWQHRGVEWARFVDRLRSIGHSISIGGPA